MKQFTGKHFSLWDLVFVRVAKTGQPATSKAGLFLRLDHLLSENENTLHPYRIVTIINLSKKGFPHIFHMKHRHPLKPLTGKGFSLIP